MAFTDLVTNIATVYLLYRQNQIFKEQNRIFARQGGASVPDEENRPRRVWISRYWPMLVMTLLVLGNLSVTAFNYYEQRLDVDIPEDDPSRTLVRGWGGGALDIDPQRGYSYSDIEVNGTRFFPYRDRYKLVAICYLWDGLSSERDAPHVQASNPYEVINGNMRLIIRLSPGFAKEANNGRQGMLHFALLQIPSTVNAGSFDTISQARALGARHVWTGASGINIPYEVPREKKQ